MNQKSSEWLETQVLVLPIPAACCGFICFPRTLPPAPTGRSHWDLETHPEPGTEPIGSDKELGAPPRATVSLEWPGTSTKGYDE